MDRSRWTTRLAKMKMEFEWSWSVVVQVVLVGISSYVLVFGLFRRLNECYYHVKYKLVGKKNNKALPLPLPPGNMGWPLVGNMWSFLRAYKSKHPQSFITNLKKRYGETGGIYKTHLFWKPSIIVCSPELCRKVLTDDEHFAPGYALPKFLFEDKPSSYDFLSGTNPRRLIKVMRSHINRTEALSSFIGSIEDIVKTSLEEMSRRDQAIEFFSEVRSIAFKVIITLFFGSATTNNASAHLASMDKYFDSLFKGLFCTPVNIPGFAFHNALKAREMLAKAIESVVAEGRERELYLNVDPHPNAKSKRGLIDLIEDSEGRKLDEEQVTRILLVLLLAGTETVGLIATWATIFLHRHPHVLEKAKAEQEEIIKKRPSSQNGLSLNEIKQMKYLSKVIDETLRARTHMFAIIRQAKTDTELKGYLIPKGWKVLVLQSAVHMDPEIYPNPNEFLPSRWDNINEDLKPTAGSFQPFGGGTMLCPGADLAKIEISIFLHYFLLNYKLEQLNPRGDPVNNFPSPLPPGGCPAKVIKQ